MRSFYLGLLICWLLLSLLVASCSHSNFLNSTKPINLNLPLSRAGLHDPSYGNGVYWRPLGVDSLNYYNPDSLSWVLSACNLNQPGDTVCHLLLIYIFQNDTLDINNWTVEITDFPLDKKWVIADKVFKTFTNDKLAEPAYSISLYTDRPLVVEWLLEQEDGVNFTIRP